MKTRFQVGACLQAILGFRTSFIACEQAPTSDKSHLRSRAGYGAGFVRALRRAAALLLVTTSVFAASTNPIVAENQKPGTRHWLLTKVDTVIEPTNPIGEDQPHFLRSTKIEGYAAQTSYAAGETVRLCISTDPVSDFAIDIYRLGYYQGNGGRLMRHVDAVSGKAQPTPDDGERNLRECRWEPLYEFVVPAEWVSGVYVAKLTRSADGFQSYVIFIVKDARKADFNFQCSDMTWQAYNRWPAWRSMYDFEDKLWVGSGGNDVSFDRPYGFYFNLLPSKLDAHINGAGEFLMWEFPLAFWMEQQGYDVTYTSNIDTHADGAGLLRTKAFLSVGHDEYWTRQMYDNVAHARDAGVNLLFLSGNAISGEVFLTTSIDGQPNRTMGRTRKFTDEEKLLGATSYGVGLGDWIVTQPDHWIYAGTGLKEGDAIKGLIGWEFHGPPLKEDPSLVVVGHARFRDDREQPAHEFAATMYDGPKGNFVFNAATCWWSMPLSVPPGSQNPPDVDFSKTDSRVQRITKNLFERVIHSPAR
jgi:hypothetical protein